MSLSPRSQALLTTLCVCVFASDCEATYPLPFWSFKKPTPNGKYIFIMIGEAERSPIGGFLEPSEAKEIRLKYSQTGLYPNDGSTVPLWTINSFWHRESDVQLASDGIHMFFLDVIAKTPSEIGLGFYRNGEPIRHYAVEDLVEDWGQCEVIRSTAKVYWSDKKRFDDKKLEFWLVTKDGNQYLFDVTTGAVISKSSAPRYQFLKWLSPVCAGSVGLLFCIWWFNRRRKKRRSYLSPPLNRLCRDQRSFTEPSESTEPNQKINDPRQS